MLNRRAILKSLAALVAAPLGLLGRVKASPVEPWGNPAPITKDDLINAWESATTITRADLETDGYSSYFTKIRAGGFIKRGRLVVIGDDGLAYQQGPGDIRHVAGQCMDSSAEDGTVSIALSCL